MKNRGSVFSLYVDRLKMILRDKSILFVFGGSIFFFLIVFQALVGDNRSTGKIPIGIVNLDEGIKSQQLIERISVEPAIYTYVLDEQEGMTLLRDGKIEALFTIHNDYSKRLEATPITNLLTVYHLENDTVGKAVVDIIAGNFIEEVTTTITREHYYERLSEFGKEVKEEDFELYIEKLKESTGFDTLFQIQTIDVDKGTNVSDYVETRLIYEKVVMSLLGTFIGFILFSLGSFFIKERVYGIENRFVAIPNGYRNLWLGNILLIISVSIFLGGTFTGLLWIQTDLVGRLIVPVLLLLISFGFAVGMGLLIIASLCSKMIQYQFIGSILLLLQSIIGSSSWNISILEPSLMVLLRLTPIYWFIEGYVNIIARKGLYLETSILFCISLVYLVVFFITYRCVNERSKKI